MKIYDNARFLGYRLEREKAALTHHYRVSGYRPHEHLSALDAADAELVTWADQLYAGKSTVEIE